MRGCLLKNVKANGINPWSCFFLCAVLLYSPLSFGGGDDGLPKKQSILTPQPKEEDTVPDCEKHPTPTHQLTEEAAVPDIEYIRVKMDKSIFLEPPKKNEMCIYLHIRDTSGNDFKLQDRVAKRLKANGYIIVKNTKHATYVLQANILFAKEISEALLQNLNKSDDGQDIGRRCADWLSGLCKQRKKEDVKKLKATKSFSVIVDIEVRERTPDKGKVIRRGRTNTEQNTSSASVDSSLTENNIYVGSDTTESEEIDTYGGKSDWVRYNARVIATAQGKDITLRDIKPYLLDKLSKSLSGVF